MDFRTSSGRGISFGRKIGEGGEGAVYEIRDQPHMVAKVYHNAVDRHKAAKLSLMAQRASPDLLAIAAWPTDVLTGRDGKVRGLVMPRVSEAREAHCLYSPKQRQQLYPAATWMFLIWAARNVAAAIATVHAAGHVIGDINQKGVLIGNDTLAKLIDCDSFQISYGDERYLCLVGVPEFTAPELAGKPFDQTVRTPNHDAFGLAVLIFHLLFMGRHPFAGRFVGAGDMPVDVAVRELRFAYSQRAASMQMAPPPHALSLTAASFPVASLFERAFGIDGTRGSRPTAQEWVKSLEALRNELKTCTDDAAHVYHKSLKSCPWCQIERSGGPSLFVPQVTGDVLRNLDIASVSAQLNALPLPLSVPDLEVSLPRNLAPTAIASTIVGRKVWTRILAAVAAIALFGTCTATLPDVAAVIGLVAGAVAYGIRPGPLLEEERRRRNQAKANAERSWQQLNEAWRRDCAAAINKFHTKRSEIDKYLSELRELPQTREGELRRLEAERERDQRRAFLERFDVETATLSGIGPGLKSMLVAYGFETAHDITTSVIRVKGIGPAKAASLLAWRRALEARFKFNPDLGVSEAQRGTVHRRILQRRRELERLIAQGVQELRGLHRRAAALRSPDLQRFHEAAHRLAQAQADAEAI